MKIMRQTITDSSIAYFRKKLDLTQKEFAERLNIKRYYFSFIETKIIIPDQELAEKISYELKASMGQLWTEAELNLISSKNNK